MPEQKDCFGQLAGLAIRFRDRTKQHFLRLDEEKLKECDHCHLFNKCMFLRYNELLKEVLTLLDEVKAAQERTRL